MAVNVSPDVIVYVCHRSIPDGAVLPRQWQSGEMRVVVRQAPCSGKMDGQYLMHALEGGACGVCIVACPKGECRLNQGNYRADIRIRTIRRLLGEIGMEPERAELIHCSPRDSREQFEKTVHEAVERICALGKSPVGVENK